MAIPEKIDSGNATLSRREALIRLLRAAGVVAGAAGLAVWLSQRSSHPEVTIDSNAKRGHTVEPNPALPEMAIIEGNDAAQLARRAVE